MVNRKSFNSTDEPIQRVDLSSFDTKKCKPREASKMTHSINLKLLKNFVHGQALLSLHTHTHTHTHTGTSMYRSIAAIPCQQATKSINHEVCHFLIK